MTEHDKPSPKEVGDVWNAASEMSKPKSTISQFARYCWMGYAKNYRLLNGNRPLKEIGDGWIFAKNNYTPAQLVALAEIGRNR
jgi:hypothetical protein